MRRAIALLFPSLSLTGLLGLVAASQNAPRPPITGIAYVRIALSDPRTAPDFYWNFLHLPISNHGCPSAAQTCFVVNGNQQVQTLSTINLQENPSGQIAQIAFATTDVDRLRRYLVAKALSPDMVKVDASGNQHFGMLDPEGHPISFVQLARASSSNISPDQVASRLIHAGFVVRDRTAEDRFYKDLLGFRVYWHGGMKDGETDWVDMQVPEGSDWLEYMLNVPDTADHRVLGVMNHIALGVPDIHAAEAQLLKNGWKPGEQPQIGRDGKWQLNLYDPNQTRVELMEFKPTEKPCCAEYSGTHPKPTP
jgi:catechol 2,3-dioxygenase-like lactoylglutathione lyase family enzyme/predicted enzyme related to lactoylglutathione lyase